MMYFHHAGRMFGDPGGWWWVRGLIPGLFLLVLIGVVVWAVVRVTRTSQVPAVAAAPPPAGRRDQALEEVRLRYARGELTREEFVERSRDLGGIELGPPGGPPPEAG